MPTERKRKTRTPEIVPDAGDPDRKRVLNVLAQRRYRRKQREKVAALEAQAKGLSLPQSSKSTRDGPEQTTSPSQTSLDERNAIEDIVLRSDVAGSHDIGFGQDFWDMQLFGDLDASSLPTPIPASPDPMSCNLLQPCSPPKSPISFPLGSDGAQLSVPILSTIRAFTSIATALNILNHVWDPDYLHTLPPTPSLHLPPNLRPTPAQMTVPHHPMLDALPWPSVREKLICILALPSALRPPVARDDDVASQGQGSAVMRLVQDLDDFQEGVRVHGNTAGWGNESELVEEAWEVGECLYQNWWWCLDEKVIMVANRKRRERGDRLLKMKSG